MEFLLEWKVTKPTFWKENSMDDRILTIDCPCDDGLNALHHHDDPQCQISNAEVMTTAMVAALFFRSNFVPAPTLLREQAYIPQMLSKSRLLRRLTRIRPLLLTLFNLLGETSKERNRESIYVLDTFPIPVCDDYRIPHAKVYPAEEYCGYQASKKRCFYEVKLHLLVTRDGQPVEFFLTPGSYSDAKDGAWRQVAIRLASSSCSIVKVG